MIMIEKTVVAGWEPAIRGMRNPMNSWALSDTRYGYGYEVPEIGANDMKLMQNLIKGGAEERKFLRMIEVWADVNAPLYWWKEYDTYKIGTVANSCSTMHKLHSRDLVESDFSLEHLDEYSLLAMGNIIDRINELRTEYVETKDKEKWYQMIQLLPASYLQRRTLMLNYEVLRNIYRQRAHHKLDEWKGFCAWIEELPYAKEFIYDGE